jgi:hypothetical protein
MTGQGSTNVGRIFRCGPTIFLDIPVSTSNGEPELPLREAAIVLLALIVFVTLMAWTAMQWM